MPGFERSSRTVEFIVQYTSKQRTAAPKNSPEFTIRQQVNHHFIKILWQHCIPCGPGAHISGYAANQGIVLRFVALTATTMPRQNSDTGASEQAPVSICVRCRLLPAPSGSAEHEAAGPAQGLM